MNDFTKNELQEIGILLKPVYWQFAHMGYPDNITTGMIIMSKIQQMIDNYCEHEWDETFSEREINRCRTCGEESL